ncbi:unnamed protein product [Lampetra planeri]
MVNKPSEESNLATSLRCGRNPRRASAALPPLLPPLLLLPQMEFAGLTRPPLPRRIPPTGLATQQTSQQQRRRRPWD